MAEEAEEAERRRRREAMMPERNPLAECSFRPARRFFRGEVRLEPSRLHCVQKGVGSGVWSIRSRPRHPRRCEPKESPRPKLHLHLSIFSSSGGRFVGFGGRGTHRTLHYQIIFAKKTLKCQSLHGSFRSREVSKLRGYPPDADATGR